LPSGRGLSIPVFHIVFFLQPVMLKTGLIGPIDCTWFSWRIGSVADCINWRCREMRRV